MSEPVEIRFPKHGKVTNYQYSKQPPETATLLNNVRPYDISDERSRGGQRPGIKKWADGDQMGINPVVAITSVTYIVST